MLEGFKVVSLISGLPVVSFTPNGVTFSKNAVIRIGRPSKVFLLLDVQGKRMAIQECKDDSVDAIAFFNNQKNQSVRWNNKDLLNRISSLMEWDLSKEAKRVKGVWAEEENAIIFNLDEAEAI